MSGFAPLIVNTDCSGMEAPIQALRNLKVPHRHLFSCDVDVNVRATIMENFPPEMGIFPDITKRDNSSAPGCDLYVAGFPCQPFSAAGLQKGFKDKRGKIFFNVLAYLEEHRPKAWILENVSRLRTMNNGKYFDAICKELGSLADGGYDIQHEVLDTKKNGVPQSRRRIYIIGVRKDVNTGTFSFPEPIPCPSIKKFLDKKKPCEEIKAFPPASQKTASTNVRHWMSELQAQGKDPRKSCYVIDVDSSTPRSKAVKDISPCITCSRGSGHWVSTRNRRFTKDEMMRLQGMAPSAFKICVSEAQLGRQLGNAMSVNVLERLLVKLLPAAGLAKQGSLEDRWETGSALKTLAGSAVRVTGATAPDRTATKRLAPAVAPAGKRARTA